MITDKLKSKKTNAIFIASIVTIFIFITLNSLVFYYKYINATTFSVKDYDQRIDMRLHIVMDELVKSGYDIDVFKEKTAQINIINSLYLFKKDAKNELDLIYTNDRQQSLGKDSIFSRYGCSGLRNHSFVSKYYDREILPENKVKVCLFYGVGDYVIGIRQFLPHTITSIKDPEFKEWFIKNMVPTFFLSSIGCALFLVFVIWGLNRYFDLRAEYIKNNVSLKRNLRYVKNQLYVDPMTKLANKSKLMDYLSEIKDPKVIIIDIDDFGRMNDYYGKEVCDNILICMANLIKEFANEVSMKAFCIGADQFVLAENEEMDMSRYEEIAEAITGRFKGRVIEVKDPKTEKMLEIEVHTTIGFALETQDTLMKATTALKMAKQNKKDYAAYFKNLTQKGEYAEQIERSNMIRQAMVSKNIVPFYQPIFNANGEILKYESLVRIVSSDEVFSPHIFLDTSKRIKRYAELQKMVISQNINRLEENEKLILSINLSGRDMLDGDVSSWLLELLNKHRVADRIVFELVEDENLDSVERVENFIAKVKNMGAKIAIDDFGSGYSNFAYILKMRPDYIKIDGSLIKNIDINHDSYMITRAIVSFARDLGIKTIAEFVHSKDIFDICKELGVDEFQGFYLGVPTGNIQ